MSGFKDDFDWQRQFIDPIRRIVGPYLLEQAPLEIDQQEATDLLVLRARDMRIGCRVRRAGYAEIYPWEFTIRSRRETGSKTEMRKIIEGWGDWLFYGHAGEGMTIARWMLVDLDSFRGHLIEDGFRADKRVRYQRQSNRDGTHFLAFSAPSFPRHPALLVASSQQIPNSAAE